jgi:hypothetical protein
MHIIASLFFLTAFAVALGIAGSTVFAYRHRIVAVLLGTVDEDIQSPHGGESGLAFADFCPANDAGCARSALPLAA